MKLTQKLTAILAAVLTVALPAAARGATASGTFTVQATVNPTCTISGALLNFGNYDPNAATPLNGSTTLTLTCTKSTGYSVALTSANGATFGMKNTTNTLNYALYSDSARTIVWDGTHPVAGTAPNRSPITLNVYGQIAINQDVPTGTPSGGVSPALTYTDTVTATVTF